MTDQVEITSFDLRYEGCRMKNKAAERKLLCSILEHGIRDPLQGVDAKHGRILLNGFKRYRCAKKLAIGIVPYCSLGTDEAFGILELMRIANARSLSIIEQAKLIDELKSVHNMTVVEIAQLLEKSPAWVSVRIGIIGEMSPAVMRRILSGEFPVYSYMYSLRPFMRLKRVKKEDIDAFVISVAGKDLSTRDIEILTQGYFKGTEEIRQQILSGNIAWGLNQLKAVNGERGLLSEGEMRMLRDLEICQKYMQRLTCQSSANQLHSNAFCVQANLLAGGIMRQMDSFVKVIGQLYDRSRETKSHISSVCRRHGDTPDLPAVEGKP